MAGWNLRLPGVMGALYYASGNRCEVLVKLIIFAAMIGIVVSLASALFCLGKQTKDSSKMVKALTIRVGLSFALIILLFGAWAAGLIQPHALSG